MLRVIQFTGTGDPMFGGGADDRALFWMQMEGGAGQYMFIPGHRVALLAFDGVEIGQAVFSDPDQALAASERAHDRVTGAPLHIG